MDLNLIVLCGRIATDAEIRTFDSGRQVVRLLVTVRQETPRRRVDVVPVTYWPDDSADPTLVELTKARKGERVWICGSVQRRFWETSDGRRSRIEVVAEQVNLRTAELEAVSA